MDTTILLISTCELLIFIFFQVFFFRFINIRGVIGWIGKSFLISLILVIVGTTLLLNISVKEKIIIVGVTTLIYSICAQVYIYGLFGIVESSLRIRILREIVETKKKGITYNELLKFYNKNTIITKRLDRFLKSGEIILNKNNYYISKKFALSYVPAVIFSLYWKIYRK